jgi:hypothetical protein
MLFELKQVSNVFRITGLERVKMSVDLRKRLVNMLDSSVKKIKINFIWSRGLSNSIV